MTTNYSQTVLTETTREGRTHNAENPKRHRLLFLLRLLHIVLPAFAERHVLLASVPPHRHVPDGKAGGIVCNSL
ncbi:unnamed protein product, partial [Brenthis ino]